MTGVSSRFAPAVQHPIDIVANRIPGVDAAGTAHQQLIVPGVFMADGGDCGGGEGAFIERLPCGGAAYSAAATSGGVRGDGTRLRGRAAWKELPDGNRRAGGQIAILFGAARLLALAAGCALIGVLEAFLFSFLECGFLN